MHISKELWFLGTTRQINELTLLNLKAESAERILFSDQIDMETDIYSPEKLANFTKWLQKVDMWAVQMMNKKKEMMMIVSKFLHIQQHISKKIFWN